MVHGGRRNGAGRKKGSTNKFNAEMKERAAVLALGALEQLGKLAVGAKSEGNQIRAATLLLNRAFGCPVEAEDEATDQPTVRPVFAWATRPEDAISDPARPQFEAAQKRDGRNTSWDR